MSLESFTLRRSGDSTTKTLEEWGITDAELSLVMMGKSAAADDVLSIFVPSAVDATREFAYGAKVELWSGEPGDGVRRFVGYALPSEPTAKPQREGVATSFRSPSWFLSSVYRQPSWGYNAETDGYVAQLVSDQKCLQ